MLNELTIERYRGLRGIHLTDLGQINIIIGENNSGKTSILEAIQLFDNSNVLENLISIARRREAQVAFGGKNQQQPFDMLLYSFAMQDLYEKEIHIEAQSEKYGRCRVGIHATLTKEFFYSEKFTREQWKRYEAINDNGYTRVLFGDFVFDTDKHISCEYRFNETERRPEFHGADSSELARLIRTSKILYISPMDIYSNKVISASLYKGMLVEEKKRLLELLQMFDERIIGIETGVQYGYPVTLIEMEDLGLVPISIFGDGLKKVLTLASAVVKMRGGIVLIDEFETGIHKHALIQVAKWLSAVTRRYDVQVFLTTHSSDAIDALVEAQLEFNEINAYRLEHYRDNIFVKRFQGTDLHSLKKNQGMDIL